METMALRISGLSSLHLGPKASCHTSVSFEPFIPSGVGIGWMPTCLGELSLVALSL